MRKYYYLPSCYFKGVGRGYGRGRRRYGCLIGRGVDGEIGAVPVTQEDVDALPTEEKEKLELAEMVEEPVQVEEEKWALLDPIISLGKNVGKAAWGVTKGATQLAGTFVGAAGWGPLDVAIALHEIFRPSSQKQRMAILGTHAFIKAFPSLAKIVAACI